MSQDKPESISTIQSSEIKTFLNARFEARAIGKDVRSIILKRIDLLAGGSTANEGITEISEFPSIAQQISWQYALHDIAADFRKAYPSRINAHSISHAPVGNSPPTSAEFLLWSIPNIVENAQGAFSATFLESPFPSYLASAQPSPRKRKVWIGWIRPAATGNEELDRRIWKSLIAAGLSSLAEREDSLPNFAIFNLGDVRSTLDSVRICARNEKCSSLPGVVGTRGSRHILGSGPKALFERLYLSNPYGERSSATAVLEVDDSSHLVKILVGPKDLGYTSLQAPPFDDLRLTNISYQLEKLRIYK